MDRILVLLLGPVVLFTTVTSKDNNVCPRPVLGSNIEMAGFQRFSNPGEELTLSCQEGYSAVSGPRKIVCGSSGEWTKTKLFCIPKLCPYPDPVPHGEVIYEETVYLSTINYTCNQGYILYGAESAECQANGTWSTSVPECKPVTCGLAPIPQFGMIVYDKMVRGNIVDYGTGGTYRCPPPYVVIGNPRTECTANGTWTEMPECKAVTCPPPANIANGYMSNQDQRPFDHMETIQYGCLGDYVLKGNLEIVCQNDGHWSEKPKCMAPCRVDIQRGRILHQGKKIWIEDFEPNKIRHIEIISVYCKDEARNCGYAISTQCINGRLTIPACFQEPSRTDYNLYPKSLPSEIKQC